VHEFVGEVRIGIVGAKDDGGGEPAPIADGISQPVEREWLGFGAAFAGEVDVEEDGAIGVGNGEWFAHEGGELGPEVGIEFGSDGLGARGVIGADGGHPGDADFAADGEDGGPLDFGEDRGLDGG